MYTSKDQLFVNTCVGYRNMFTWALEYAVNVLICLTFLIFPSTGLYAQSNLGGITGTILDSTGAVIPNASVTIINLGTNRKVDLVTSEQGTYSLPNLEPVSYRIEASAKGFSTKIVESVKVNTASITTVNISLEAGISTVEVDIKGEPSLINTETGAQGATITERMITELPIAEQNVLQLALTIPNVSGYVGSEDPDYTGGVAQPGAQLNINGGRPGESSILADGVTNTGVSISRQVVSFSRDVVQEMTVQTSTFSAEYGRTGGGIINTTTKSGSNDFHGLLSWFNRTPSFNAKDYNPGQAVAPRDALRENRGAFTLGGPVYLPRFGEGGPALYDGHNKTFFFFSFEPRWRTDGEFQYSLLPDEGMLRGDFSNVVNVPGGFVRKDVAQKLGVRSTGDLILYKQFNLVNGQLARINTPNFEPFQGNVIPSEYLDQNSQRLLKYMPKPGDYFILNGQVRNYVGGRFVEINEKRHSIRIDHQITNDNRMYVRYTNVPIFGEKRRGGPQERLVNANISDYSASKQFLISDNHTFSPTMFNTLNLNYTRGLYDRTAPMEWQTQNLSTELGLPSGTSWGLPQFNTGPYTIGLAGSLNNNTVGLVKNQEETYNINNVLSKITGPMTWKFGVNLEQQSMSNSHVGTFQGGIYNFNNSLTNSALASGSGGHSFATFLLGIPTGWNMRTAIVPYKYVWRSMDLFVQNDWKLKPNFTLNLGLRYSLELPRVERSDLQGYFDLDNSVTRTLSEQELRTLTTTLQAINPNFPVHLIPKETLIPAFAFVGRGGRSRYLQPIDKNNFMPRIGFAWSPNLFGFNESGGRVLVVRGGYGMSYLALRGDNRRPVPDLGGQAEAGYNPLGSGITPNYFVRLGSNPPRYSTTNPLLDIPENGLVTTNSLFLSLRDSFALSPSYQIPYTHNWSLGVEFSLMRDTSLELTYQGNYSNTLFFPPTSVNSAPFSYIEALQTLGIDPSRPIPDPLGRRDSQNRLANIPLSTLASPFLGFTSINERYKAESRNFRNAATVYLKRRFSSGIAGTAAYTFGKTLNESSDSGTDNVGFSRTINQSGFGTSPRTEYSVADFDITHTFSSTFLFDLPFGSGRKFFSLAPGWLNTVINGWTLSGTYTAHTGLPIKARLQDPNGLTGGSGNVRPNLNPNEPVLNPLWRRECPFGEGCEPYANPAAFYRPAKGTVGNAPRTIGWARYPGRSQLDLSIQKEFYVFGKERKRRLQFRVDAINALNQVNFRFDGNNAFNWTVEGGGYPNEADISRTEFTNWVNANPQHGINSTNFETEYNKVLAITRRARGGATTGPLPANFFSRPIPRGFASTIPNSFDIRTEEGLKLYRLRNAFNSSEFGQLDRAQRMRIITFAIRLYF
jgi:hypothetical protein